jgi:hypothetical protein
MIKWTKRDAVEAITSYYTTGVNPFEKMGIVTGDPAINKLRDIALRNKGIKTPVR